MTNTSTMTEKFAGKYSFESQDNFDAYVKDIGKNCNYFLFYARVSISTIILLIITICLDVRNSVLTFY